ncbi:MAG: Na/Pi cotransporter family protein [Erysipelotrichaceae bacterium]|nr:Na/Pi cotransporter family protein [Erysipelotrichaceae bacterium]MBQ6217633.1 Na/Pi cotransporter family protein [Erysipelotrichaceae bacterium]
MESTSFFYEFLHLLAGIGIFLTGCEMMSSNLEAVCSDRLRELLAKVSNNKIVGVLIGTVATIAISSSGAMTVMAIGFVNAHIISMRQAATIIFGGEIGTTLTGQLVALGMMGGGDGVDMNFLFSALAGLGVFITMFAKKDKIKLFGAVLTGFGLLFAGLDMMSGAMSGFSQSPALKEAIARVNSSFLLIIFGAILTALIQSSTAITSISISMVAVGLINISQGIYLTLGANVGTCLTGMLAGMKSEGINAKRTSLMQLIFNIGGVLLVYVIDLIMKIASGGALSFGILFERMFPGLPHTQLAMFHTIFNIASVIIVLPLVDSLVALTEKIIKDEPPKEKKEKFYFVDENILTTPSIAVEQIKQEIVHMANTAMQNFNISMDMIKTLNFDRQSELDDNEAELNFLNKELVELIIKLGQEQKMNKKDSRYLSSTYKTIADLERIGDYAANLAGYARNLGDEKFSDNIVNEMEVLRNLINRLYLVIIDSYQNDKRKITHEIKDLRDNIQGLVSVMVKIYIKRLNEKELTTVSSGEYLKICNDTKRVAEHLINLIDTDYVLNH